MNHIILDRVTEIVLHDRRAALQKEALELTSYIKQNQDVTHTLVNICQRYVRNQFKINHFSSICKVEHGGLVVNLYKPGILFVGRRQIV